MPHTRLRLLQKEMELRKGQRREVQRSLKESKEKEMVLRRRLKLIEEAQAVIQIVSKRTQEELEYHISELVSLALNAVFPDPYELKLKFEVRRGKTEADLLFSRGGEIMDPLTASGGGPVDVASFALRVALWSLRRPRTRAVLVLDEPFRFLSRDLQPKASLMLSEISKRLGLQIIMISHSPDLIESADKVFEVTMRRKGRSLVQ